MEKIPVKICIGTTCYLLGASKLVDLESQLPEAWKGRVTVSGCTCLDLCDAEGVSNAPFVKVGDTVVSHATPVSVMAAIADAVVVCGGTTANIVTRELGAKVSMDLRRMREAGDLPPCGEIEGIGLATEGVLTLARMRNADRIEFCVGTKVNEAHQDPNLPAELDLRRNVLHDIAAALETRYRKQTSFHYY